MKRGYIVRAYIPVDESDTDIYDNICDALSDQLQLEEMHPENIYEIETVDLKD